MRYVRIAKAVRPVMALKKSQIYSTLWQSCDELRGGMDASQYKDYVLTLLFMKYVSDKYAGKPFAPIQVPEGGSFADMVKLCGDKDIGDDINKIIGKRQCTLQFGGAMGSPPAGASCSPWTP